MRQTDGKFKGIKDYELYYQAWLPDAAPKAILLVVHGLAEHIGRYQNLVDYFVPRGYAIYGFDLRGHGKSPGWKGYADRFTDYIDDVKLFFDKVRRENPANKIFIVGHSMGGLIAASYAIQYQADMAGLVLSGPTLKVGTSISPVTIVLARLLSVLVPKMGVAVLDASAISRDKAVVDAYIGDPLVYRGKTSARLGAELLNTIRRIPVLMERITLPLLVMYGGDDRISNPSGSKILHQKAGSKDKTLKVYDGLYHEIFNEPEHEKVMADMETWLTARV
jgi:acylglycerol lipase